VQKIAWRAFSISSQTRQQSLIYALKIAVGMIAHFFFALVTKALPADDEN
jgi:hypothetical protein